MSNKGHGLTKRFLSGFLAFCMAITGITIAYAAPSDGDFWAKITDENEEPLTNVQVMLYGGENGPEELLDSGYSDIYGNINISGEADGYDRYFFIISQNKHPDAVYTEHTKWGEYDFQDISPLNAAPEPANTEDAAEGEEGNQESHETEPEENSGEDLEESEEIPSEEPEDSTAGEDSEDNSTDEGTTDSEESEPEDAAPTVGIWDKLLGTEVVYAGEISSLSKVWIFEVEKAEQRVNIEYNENSAEYLFNTGFEYYIKSEDRYPQSGINEMPILSGGTFNVELKLMPSVQLNPVNIGFAKLRYGLKFKEGKEFLSLFTLGSNEDLPSGTTAEILNGDSEYDYYIELNASQDPITTPIQASFVGNLIHGTIPDGSAVKMEVDFAGGTAYKKGLDKTTFEFTVDPDNKVAAFPIDLKVSADETWEISMPENAKDLQITQNQPISAVFEIKSALTEVPDLNGESANPIPGQFGRLYFNDGAYNQDNEYEDGAYKVTGSFNIVQKDNETVVKTGGKVTLNSFNVILENGQGLDLIAAGVVLYADNNQPVSQGDEFEIGRKFIIDRYALAQLDDGCKVPFTSSYEVKVSLPYEEYYKAHDKGAEPPQYKVILNTELEYTLTGDKAKDSSDASSSFVIGGYIGDEVVADVTITKQIAGGGYGSRLYSASELPTNVFKFYLLNKEPSNAIKNNPAQLASFLADADNYARIRMADGTYVASQPQVVDKGTSTAKFENVYKGTYYLYESVTSSHQDYVPDSNWIKVEISNNTAKNITVTNKTDKVGFRFTKTFFDGTGKQTAASLYADTKFKLEEQVNSSGYSETAVPLSNGQVDFYNLEKGKTYVLTEINAPNGYATAQPITFTVNANASGTVYFNSGVQGVSPMININQRELRNFSSTGALKVIKKYQVIGAYKPQAGAKFEIYKDDHTTLVTTATTTGIYNASTGFTIVVPNLPAGTYYVKEVEDINNPDYEAEEQEYEVTIKALSENSGNPTELTITNVPKVTLREVKIKVVVLEEKQGGGYNKIAKAAAIASFDGIHAGAIRNASGGILNPANSLSVPVNGVTLYMPVGDYTGKGVNVTASTDMYIARDQGFKVNDGTGAQEITIVIAKKGKLEVFSYFENNGTKQGIANSVYALYKEPAEKVGNDLKTVQTGKVSTSPIEPNLGYFVKEISFGDAKYKLNSDYTSDTLTADNSGRSTYDADTIIDGHSYVSSNATDIVFEINHELKKAITINLVDVYSGKRLDGKFEIKSSEGSEGHAVTVSSKDTAGTVVYVNSDDYYTVTQTETANGYFKNSVLDNTNTTKKIVELASDSQTIPAGNTANFYNLKKASAEFTKVEKDFTYEKAHVGVKFTLNKYDANNQPVGAAGNYYTDTQGNLKISDLDPRYSYKLEEESSASHILNDPIVIEFTIDANSTDEDYKFKTGDNKIVNEIDYRQIEIIKRGYKTKVENGKKVPDYLNGAIQVVEETALNKGYAYNGKFEIYEISGDLLSNITGGLTPADVAQILAQGPADIVYTGTNTKNSGLSKFLKAGKYLIVEKGSIDGTNELYPFDDPNASAPAFGKTGSGGTIAQLNPTEDNGKDYYIVVDVLPESADKVSEVTFYNPERDWPAGPGVTSLFHVRFSILKKDKDTDMPLNGAEFEVYRAKIDPVTQNPVSFNDVNKSTDFIQKLVTGTSGNGKSTSIVDRGVLTLKLVNGQREITAQKGNVIKEGDKYYAYYYVYETKAPAGYYLTETTRVRLVKVELDLTKSNFDPEGVIIAHEEEIYNSVKDITITVNKKVGAVKSSQDNTAAGNLPNLSNVTIGLYNASSNELASEKTNQAGTITFKVKNESAAYYVQEKSYGNTGDSDKYQMLQDMVPVKISDSNKNVGSAVIYNFPKLSLKINKVDSQGLAIPAAALGQIKFKSYKADALGNWIEQQTITAQNGNIVVSGIEFGKYKFEETTPPEGYYNKNSNGDPISFELEFSKPLPTEPNVSRFTVTGDAVYNGFSGNTVTVTVQNDAVNKITINKEYYNSSGVKITGNDLNPLLNDTKFSLYKTQADAEAETNPISIGGKTEFVPLISSNKQYGTISVPVDATLNSNAYYVKEVGTASGYTLGENETPIRACIFQAGEEKNAAKAVTFNNYISEGLLIVNKTSMQNQPLTAEFDIYSVERNADGSFTAGSKVRSNVSTSGGAIKASLSGGWYKVVEVKAPTGYNISADIYFNNSKDEVADKFKPEGTEACYIFVQNNSETAVVFKNDVLGKIKLIKFVKVTDSFEMRLKEVGLGLVAADSTPLEIAKDANGADLKGQTDANGEIVFENVLHGTYWVVELDAPDGYSIPDALNIDKIEGTPESERYSITVKPEDTYAELKIENKSSRGFLEIKKYVYDAKDRDDKENKAQLISGADASATKFTLYKKTASGQQELEEITIGSNGTYFFSGLDAGDYIVKETGFSENYPKTVKQQRENGLGQVVEIKAGEYSELKFYNEKARNFETSNTEKTISSVETGTIEPDSKTAGIPSLVTNGNTAEFTLKSIFDGKNNVFVTSAFAEDSGLLYYATDSAVINPTAQIADKYFYIDSITVGKAIHGEEQKPVYAKVYYKSIPDSDWQQKDGIIDLTQAVTVDLGAEKAVKFKVDYYGDANGIYAHLDAGFYAEDIQVNAVFPQWETSDTIPEISKIENKASFGYNDSTLQAPVTVSTNKAVIKVAPEARPKSELSVSKIVSSSALKAGDTVNYAIEVKNSENAEGAWKYPIIADKTEKGLYYSTDEPYVIKLIKSNNDEEIVSSDKIDFINETDGNGNTVLIWYMKGVEVQPGERLKVELKFQTDKYDSGMKRNTAAVSSGFFYKDSPDGNLSWKASVSSTPATLEFKTLANNILISKNKTDNRGTKDWSDNTYIVDEANINLTLSGTSGVFKQVLGDRDNSAVFLDDNGKVSFDGWVKFKVGIVNVSSGINFDRVRLIDVLPELYSGTQYDGKVTLKSIEIEPGTKVYGLKDQSITATDLRITEYLAQNNGVYSKSFPGADWTEITDLNQNLEDYTAIAFEYDGTVESNKILSAVMTFDVPDLDIPAGASEADIKGLYQDAFLSPIANKVYGNYFKGNNDPGNLISSSSEVTAKIQGKNSQISGFVWHDANENGLFDADESRIEGATVKLYQKKPGDVEYTAYKELPTNADGEFLFEDVPCTMLINGMPYPSNAEYFYYVKVEKDSTEFNTFTEKDEDGAAKDAINSKVFVSGSNEGCTEEFRLDVAPKEFRNAGLLNKYSGAMEKIFAQESELEAGEELILELYRKGETVPVKVLNIPADANASGQFIAELNNLRDGTYYIVEKGTDVSSFLPTGTIGTDALEFTFDTTDNLFRSDEFNLSESIINNAISITVENTRVDDGKLTIVKEIDYLVSDEDSHREFVFNVKGPNGYDENVTITVNKDTKTGEVTLENLLRGQYTVEESINNTYYTVGNITVDPVSAKQNIANNQAVINIDGSVAVKVNYLNKAKVGKLEVEKVLLDGLGNDISVQNRVFKFKLRNLNDKVFETETAGIYSDTREFTVQSGSKFIIDNIPVGSYQVTEIAEVGKTYHVADQYEIKAEMNGTELSNGEFSINCGMIGNGTIAIKVTNKEKMGSIKVTKVIASDSISKYSNEKFTIELIRIKTDGTEETVGTVNLGKDESHIFQNLAPGKYKVVETNLPSKWERVSGSDTTEYIVGAGGKLDHEVTVSNSFKDTPPPPPPGPGPDPGPRPRPEKEDDPDPEKEIILPLPPSIPGEVVIPEEEIPLGKPEVKEEEPEEVEIIEEEIPLDKPEFNKENPKTGAETVRNTLILVTAGALGLWTIRTKRRKES